ncbi:MAG: tetratricopeptide repeat protein, partial [Alphaproteobacteria bacterium]|nr:tetratricopeptide repeat protein [Alphaproteobacteria bacterium]
LLDMEEPGKAREVYARSVAGHPDATGGYSGLARAALKLGDTAASVAAMGECIRRFPGHRERHWWLPFLGNALCSLGSWDQAEEVFTEAAREAPEEAAGHSGLARVALHRNDWPRAATLLQDCIARFPDHPDMKWWKIQVRECETHLALRS